MPMCGPVQVKRCVLNMKIAKFVTQPSAGMPRHLPQDMIAPAPMTNDAAKARKAGGPHGADHSANAASTAPTA